MLIRICTLGLATSLMFSASARAADWNLHTGTSNGSLSLTFGEGEPVSYRFVCSSKDVVVTQTGVTKLLDLKTGTPISDGPEAEMPDGAAMMALSSGKGDPQFVPAQATKNPAGGWDLAIRLQKDDKQLKAIGKSDMMSLFTTGFTMAVPMDKPSKAMWNEFMQRCQAAT